MFVQNLAALYVANSSVEMVIFDPKEMLEIFDLRLVGYFRINQGILHQHVSIYYKFESADTLCE